MRRFALLALLAFAALSTGVLDIARAKAEVVGTVTRLRGDVSAETAGKSRTLAQDAAVDLGDRLRTGPDARLEVMFFDGTQLTLGERADFTIDQLVVGKDSGTALFTRTAGAIKLLAGAVAKTTNSRVEVASAVATIGIRGTEVWGGTIKPGSLLDVFLIEGAVEVRTPAGIVVLDQAGLGTSVTAAGGVAQAPTQWQPALRDQAFATVSFDTP